MLGHTRLLVARDDHNIFWAFDAQALSQGLCKPGEPKRCAASVGWTMTHRWPVAAEQTSPASVSSLSAKTK